jgi:hypothetical protein
MNSNEKYDITIKFQDEADAKAMRLYVKEDLRLNCDLTVSDNDEYLLAIKNASDWQARKISLKNSAANIGQAIAGAVNTTKDGLIGAASFAAGKIAAPIAQAGIKTCAEAGKVAAKTTIAIAASAIGTICESARKAKEELAVDPEVSKARQELGKAWANIKSLTGSKSQDNFKIEKAG